MYSYDSRKNTGVYRFKNIFLIRRNFLFQNDFLLCLSPFVSDNVLIWLLPNHHTPDYFKKFGLIVTSCEKDLNDFINDKISFDLKGNCIKKLTKKELNNFDPIKKIANTLLILNKK